MQALRKQTNYRTAELLVFPAPMANTPWTRPQKLTLAGIIVAGIVALAAIFTYLDTYSQTKQVEVQSKQTELNNAIDLRISQNPKLGEISSKLEAISSQLSALEGWKEGITSKVKIVQESQKKLNTRVDQQTAFAKLIDPNRTLALIRAQIEIAERRGGAQIPTPTLADYRNAVQALPASANDYWTTVAAIINYQSKLNQMSGKAPDPEKVSNPCPGLSRVYGHMISFNNSFMNESFANCVVDLDTNAFTNVTFRDSVIRYHGGPILLSGVAFVNCRFILDLPEKAPTAPNPEQTKFLMTLLDSVDQGTVKLATHS